MTYKWSLPPTIETVSTRHLALVARWSESISLYSNCFWHHNGVFLTTARHPRQHPIKQFRTLAPPVEAFITSVSKSFPPKMTRQLATGRNATPIRLRKQYLRRSRSTSLVIHLQTKLAARPVTPLSKWWHNNWPDDLQVLAEKWYPKTKSL